MPVDTNAPPLLQTNLPGIRLWKRGKVRDVYELGDKLLVVATDRLSAFDVVLPTGIPGKGVLLTQMSLFWFELLKDVVPHHVVSADVAQYPAELRPFRDQLEGRSMLVQKTDVLPIECVVRGYIVGSGWKDYKKTGAICGITLPAGLSESDRLEPPIFTPATKAETGHDENISYETMVETVGQERAAQARRVSLEIYERARAHAEARGIIVADTKFEFGVRDGRLIWIDEALTPDSSRFWPRDAYALGPVAAQLRQAVRARLPRDPRLGQAAAGPRAPSGSRRAHRGEVRGGVRAPPGGGPLSRPRPWPAGRGANGSSSREARVGSIGRRDGRQGDPFLRGQARVRKALHHARAAAAPRQPVEGRQGPAHPPQHARQEDRRVQAEPVGRERSPTAADAERGSTERPAGQCQRQQAAADWSRSPVDGLKLAAPANSL